MGRARGRHDRPGRLRSLAVPARPEGASTRGDFIAAWGGIASLQLALPRSGRRRAARARRSSGWSRWMCTGAGAARRARGAQGRDRAGARRRPRRVRPRRDVRGRAVRESTTATSSPRTSGRTLHGVVRDDLAARASGLRQRRPSRARPRARCSRAPMRHHRASRSRLGARRRARARSPTTSSSRRRENLVKPAGRASSSPASTRTAASGWTAGRRAGAGRRATTGACCSSGCAGASTP